MTNTTRRDLIAGLAVAGGAMAAAGAASAQQLPTLDITSVKKDTDIACLYHCDFGDPGRVGQMITNIDNHLSVYDYDPFKAKIVIVAHGQGIRPFLDNLEGTPWANNNQPPELLERFRALAKLGVEVYLCQITFKRNKIDPSRARAEPFVKMVPSGVATVAELQAKGFAYLKVG